MSRTVDDASGALEQAGTTDAAPAASEPAGTTVDDAPAASEPAASEPAGTTADAAASAFDQQEWEEEQQRLTAMFNNMYSARDDDGSAGEEEEEGDDDCCAEATVAPPRKEVAVVAGHTAGPSAQRSPSPPCGDFDLDGKGIAPEFAAKVRSLPPLLRSLLLGHEDPATISVEKLLLALGREDSCAERKDVWIELTPCHLPRGRLRHLLQRLLADRGRACAPLAPCYACVHAQVRCASPLT